MMRLLRSSLSLLLLVVCSINAQDEFLDRWNYYGTEQRVSDNSGTGTFMDYGPPDWGDIECNENNRETLDECLAYRDKWHTGREWDIKDNYCRWCPADLGFANCGRHHQSPINLERDRAILGHENEKECIDVHWMKYEDSYCTLDQLMDADAFTVERHALRITQPITVFDNNDIRIDCNKPGVGRKFGRIDFSKGFSQWWFLSHIDVHTPSEHTQEGKRYDGEIQLQHFYSASAEEAGVSNEMGTVSIFLQAYQNAPPYRYLDKLICLWRRHEYLVRQECGLDPVPSSYPGCFPIRNRGRRNLRNKNKKNNGDGQSFQTVQDVLLYHQTQKKLGITNTSSLPKLIMDDVNWGPPEDKDWDAWIDQESAKLKQDDMAYDTIRKNQDNEDTDDDDKDAAAHESFRKLLEGDEIEWFNYFPMVGVRTEYYYRYSGSQTIPPCYGNFQPDSREETNHWRVLKDPIRIHPRQLSELQRLIAARIAPVESQVNACRPDTAARVSNDGTTVEAARPIQYHHAAHFDVFCECQDWRSKWPEDREWCAINDIQARFYEQPYNFQTDGF
jgi:hypothetical protein